MEELSFLEMLSCCTVRIHGTSEDGSNSTGTGFIINLVIENHPLFQVIVTNKHVVKGMKDFFFRFKRADDLGNPLFHEHIEFEIDNSNQFLWEDHPDDSIDLCIAPMFQFSNTAREKYGTNIFYRAMHENFIPNETEWNELDIVEDILMMGYPNGQWDDINNQPIIRKGITATHPKYNFKGKKEFLIDAAVFPGSSGSPVLVYNKDSFSSKHGGYLTSKNRVNLIGILYATLIHTAEGDFLTYPDYKHYKSELSIPNNLGVVIKADQLMAFKGAIKNRIDETK